jgi:hypothetical protein
MRVIWNDTEGWFQVDFGREELAIVKQAGFKTLGPSSGWIWKTQKASVLNKLRKLNPASGVAITELALQKYTVLNTQETEKKKLKKQFEKESYAAQTKANEYLDPYTGIVCFVTEPALEPFTWKFTPPKPPETYCFVCGDPTYFPEQSDLCIWCEGNS